MNTFSSQDVAGATGRCGFPWQYMIVDLTGDVLPCCYYHFAGAGGSLGNANINTLDEIWNGAGFQDLRRRHVTGDFAGHPCDNCLAHRTMGTYPRFDWGDAFREERGFCYNAHIPESFWGQVKDRASEVQLLEDGEPLGHPNAIHEEIRLAGGGRYSVWHGIIFMSSSDNTSPMTNGRSYALRLDQLRVDLPAIELGAVSGRNLVASHEDYLSGRTVVESKPSKITFIQTSDCNIDCPSCSQNEVRLNRIRHRPETPAAVAAMVPYLQELIWHGGEPYLIPELRRFIDDFDPLSNPNLSFGFMSNGTMITAKEAEKLRRFPRTNVTISVDSFVSETYAKLRAGASYDRVMANLDRLLRMKDWPAHKLTVAMIIGKTNMRELHHNLQYGMARDIKLMINPITQYPLTEQLTVFANFETQTRGWDEVISAAEELLAEGNRTHVQSLRNLDPTGAVREIRAIYEQNKREQEDLVDVTVRLDDPHDSLSRMRRPLLLAYRFEDGPSSAAAYAELSPGMSSAKLKIPRQRFRTPLVYGLVADAYETAAILLPDDSRLDPDEGASVDRALTISNYEPPPRPKNIHYVQLSSLAGFSPAERTEMMSIYAGLAETERAMGFGFDPDIAAAGTDDPVPPKQRAADVWRNFLANYFRPFASGDYVRHIANRFD